MTTNRRGVVMTTEEIVARAIWRNAFSSDVEDWADAMKSVLWAPCMTQARAVVAALAEAGRLVPEGVTVRYGWQSGDSAPGAWSASRVAVEQP